MTETKDGLTVPEILMEVGDVGQIQEVDPEKKRKEEEQSQREKEVEAKKKTSDALFDNDSWMSAPGL